MSTNPQKNPITVRQQEWGTELAKNMPAMESLGVDAKRMCRIAMNELARKPDLLNCDRTSFILAVMNCAESGLEPIFGQAALVPYKGKIQFQAMYQGLVDLAFDTAKIIITADVVWEGDEFQFSQGLDERLVHIPKGTHEVKMGAYAIAKYPDGRKTFVYLQKDEIESIRGRSPASKSEASPWNQGPFAEAEMWKKTAIKRLYKLLPKNRRMHSAIEADEASDRGEIRIPEAVDITAEVQAVADIKADGVITMPTEKKEEQQKPVEDWYFSPAKHIRIMKPETETQTKNETTNTPGTIVDCKAIKYYKKGKNGKPTSEQGTRYRIELATEGVADPTVFGTFDSKLFDRAQTLQGESVFVEWSQDGRYKTIRDISICRG